MVKVSDSLVCMGWIVEVRFRVGDLNHQLKSTCEMAYLCKHAAKQHVEPGIILDPFFKLLDSWMNGFRILVDMFNCII
jgi:hypothetical protein